MIIYDETIHVPVRGAANASKGIRFSTRKNGEPKKLIAEREDGQARRYHIIEVFDPGATPKAHYHGPGAYLFVVLRSDLEDAERFAARDPGSDAGAVHAQAGPDQGLGAEGAEGEPRKTASDAVAAVNRGRVGSLAIPHSREYLEALRRQVQDWLAAIEEELGTSSDPAVDAYEILERRALSAVPGSVHNGEYRCPSGRAKIDLNGMADELAEVGSADVRTHRTGRPRARELDRVLAAWRSAGLTIYA